MEVIFTFWFILAVVIGFAANSRGRSGFGWFVLALILSPLLAGVLLLLFGTPANAKAGPAPAAGFEAATPETHVRCPECRELVRKDARKCRHCGTALVPQM